MDLCNNRFLLRLTTLGEAGLFYSNDQADRVLGTVGHVRIGFGSSGNGLYHTWWSHNGDQFNTPEFKEAPQQFVDTMRADGPLKSLPPMDRFCRQNGGATTENGRSYGYLVGMGSYRFCLRCTPSPGEYQCYLYCYDLRQQTPNRPVGRMILVNGEHMEFIVLQNYPRIIRRELFTKDLASFRFETLTDDPAVRKAADDMVYDLHGEENPRPLEDHMPRQGPSLRELSM